MKKIIYITAFVSLLLPISLSAQQDAKRRSTKIADLLAIQPAAESDQLTAAMQQLDRFTAQDITGLLLGLKPQGGDNARIEYATNSYAYYVMQPDKEVMRAKFVQGVTDALSQLSDKDSKGYLLNLLQIAGKDDAVSAVASCLADGYLADRAAKTLARIHSQASGNALLAALASTKGAALVSVLEALGDVHYGAAERQVIPYANSTDLQQRKTALYTLAQLGMPGSEETLRKAAEAVHFGYDEANATAAYISYANQLVKKGEETIAEKVAETLLKAGKDQTPTRIAGLTIMNRLKGQNYTAQLVKAARSDNPVYGIAALKLAAPTLKGNAVNQWGKAIRKTPPLTQAAILQALSNTNDKNALPYVEKALDNRDTLVRQSAIKAYAKLGGTTALPRLLELLADAEETDRKAMKEVLLTMKGDRLSEALIRALDQATPANQLLFMEVLANRQAKEAFKPVSQLLKSENVEVKAAAYQHLAALADRENIPFLISDWQNSQDTSEIQALQRALIAAVVQGESQEEAITEVLSAYNQSSPRQQTRFLQLFGGIGKGIVLKPVLNALQDNDPTHKNEAVMALANWKDPHALPELIKLSRNVSDETQKNALIKGIVRLVGQATFPAEQKVLLLRDAMEVAAETTQKKMILNAMQASPTYNALIFSGRYLDDPALKPAAAMAVLNIALANPDLYGVDVRSVLDKTLDALSGNDSDYLKQALLKHIAELPKRQGWVALFNGKDLKGWKGLVEDPIKRSKMSNKELSVAQAKADEIMRQGWYVKNGTLYFNGKGSNIATTKQYGDFEMLVDWKLSPIGKEGDAGIYLRGTPQVQIWDTSRVNVGAQVGSGGLYNNQKNESKPLLVADNLLGEWNTFKIRMKGDKVTVYLNGQLVTDSVTLENYWDRSLPIFPIEQIELQAHGTEVAYRDIYIRELPRREVFRLPAEEKKEGFEVLFDGTNLDAWTGNTNSYQISEEGTLACYPSEDSGGNLYSKEEYSDFIYRFSFRLTPGANNGIGIRAPMKGDAAYVGMEIQVLDHDDPIYKTIKQYQYHGSVYGVIPAKRSVLKPVGEWNDEEIYVRGNKIKVTLNGAIILDGDIAEASKNGTIDGKDHPGLKRKSGHLGFLGHGSEVHFKNIRIKRL